VIAGEVDAALRAPLEGDDGLTADPVPT